MRSWIRPISESEREKSRFGSAGTHGLTDQVSYQPQEAHHK